MPTPAETAGRALGKENPAVGWVCVSAQNAGFSDARKVTLPGAGRVSALAAAIAVAMEESGGNAAATNTNTNGSIDRGLWQINSVHLGPGGQLRGKFTEQDLLNADRNAEAAYIISKGGTDWTPWSAVKNGRAGAWAKANLTTPGMERYIMPSGSPSATEVVKGVVSDANPAAAIGAIADAIGAFFGAILDVGWWKRAGLFVTGIALLGVGLALVSEDSLLPPQIKAVAELAGKLS